MKISFDMLLSAVLSAPFVHAKDMKHSGRGLNLRGTENAKQPVAVRSLDESLFGTPKSSKAGKQVCLEYAFVNDVVIKGLPTSSNPLEGPTKDLCAPELAECATAAFDPESKECEDYQKCLVEAGSLAGPWWLNRDVYNGEAYFTDDALCGRITKTDDNSRTRFELWDENVNEPLSRYREFKVDYDIIATGGNDGYVNLYVRTSSTRDTYYDCNFVFNTDGIVGSGQILIDLDTPSDSARLCTSANCLNGNAADNTGCVDGLSLQDYITANNGGTGAVMGVGNGETYTHVLNTGSTNEDNSGSDVCWKDAVFTRVDENGVQVISEYEFTLN